MKSLLVATDASGQARLESLALPFFKVGATMTDADRAGAPGSDLSGAYRSIRAMHYPDGGTRPASGYESRQLLILVSGSVEVSAAYSKATLNPGDVLFVNDLSSTRHELRFSGDSRAIEIEVSDDFQPMGEVPPPVDENLDASDRAPKIKQIYVDGEQSHFGDFGHLFSNPARRPLGGMSLTCLSPGLFGDWHTDRNVNLVVVLSGGFELEVGGGGGSAEVFRAGDVCLVDDRTGQGHITRTHGETRFAGLTLADGESWS